MHFKNLVVQLQVRNGVLASLAGDVKTELEQNTFLMLYISLDTVFALVSQDSTTHIALHKM